MRASSLIQVLTKSIHAFHIVVSLTTSENQSQLNNAEKQGKFFGENSYI